MCAHDFAPPVCPCILYGAILARKEADSVIIINHCRVTFYRSFHLAIPTKFNTSLRLFLDICPTFLDQVLRFVYRRTQKPSFGHFRHVHGEARVWPFNLYPTSLPCDSSRHFENEQDDSCCFWKWESPITSTIYAFVASSKVIKAIFVHSRGCLSPNSSAKMSQLTTLWCSISRTVRIKAFVDLGGIPFRAARYWSRSSLCILAVHHPINWQQYTMIWTYSHPIAYCVLFVLCPVLGMIFNVCPGSCYWWLHWQLRGVLTGVCVDAVDLAVMHWMKRPLFRSIRIGSCLSELFV